MYLSLRFITLVLEQLSQLSKSHLFQGRGYLDHHRQVDWNSLPHKPGLVPF